MSTDVQVGDTVKIISDRTYAGSRVVTADGALLDRVTRAVVTIDWSEPPSVDLTVILPALDLTMQVREIERICPTCGHREVES